MIVTGYVEIRFQGLRSGRIRCSGLLIRKGLHGTEAPKHLAFKGLRTQHLKLTGLYLAYRSRILEEFPLIKTNDLSSSYINK